MLEFVVSFDVKLDEPAVCVCVCVCVNSKSTRKKYPSGSHLGVWCHLIDGLFVCQTGQVIALPGRGFPRTLRCLLLGTITHHNVDHVLTGDWKYLCV